VRPHIKDEFLSLNSSNLQETGTRQEHTEGLLQGCEGVLQCAGHRHQSGIYYN
jgi:hypothetical protein